MSNRISSFPPVIDQNSKILILGSIPGAKSLRKQEYYGHPQNKFWKIIFHILNEPFSKNYTEKLRILKKNHIALWDVIDSCERKGSLDSAIKNEKANPILDVLEKFSQISVIFCNGGKAFKNVKKNSRKKC